MSSVAPQSRVRVQRIAEAAVERARLTVVPRTRRVRAPRVPFVTLVSLLLVGGVVGLLMFNTSMQQTSFTVSALEADAAELQSRQQTLEMRLDELRDPQRLGVWARNHGMVQPDSPAFLLMDGSVLGQPEPAVPDDGTGFDPSSPTTAPASTRPPRGPSFRPLCSSRRSSSRPTTPSPRRRKSSAAARVSLTGSTVADR